MPDRQPRESLNFGSTLSATVWVAILAWTLSAWRYGALALSDLKPLMIFVGEALLVLTLAGAILVFAGKVFSLGTPSKRQAINLNFHWLNLVWFLVSAAALWVLLVRLHWVDGLSDDLPDGWPYLLAAVFLVLQIGNAAGGRGWLGKSDPRKGQKTSQSSRTTSSSPHDGGQTTSLADMLSPRA